MEKTEPHPSQKCTLIRQKATDTSCKKGISDEVLKKKKIYCKGS